MSRFGHLLLAVLAANAVGPSFNQVWETFDKMFRAVYAEEREGIEWIDLGGEG